MEMSQYASRLSSRVVPISSDRLAEDKKSLKRAMNPMNTEIASPSTASKISQEPDDALITGGTRSLSRRLLALNIPDLHKLQKKTA